MTAAGIAKGVGIGTVALLAVGTALVAAMLRDVPEYLAECVRDPECRDEIEDEENQSGGESEDSSGNGLSSL